MEAKSKFFIYDILERFASMLADGNFDMDREEAKELLTWLLVYKNHFDRQKVNQHLLQYASGDRESIYLSRK